MSKRIGFGGLCVIFVILSGCTILQGAVQDSASSRIRKGLSKTQLALGGPIPDGLEEEDGGDIYNGVYIDRSEGILFISR
jgi:hypothetical protein